MMRMEAGLWLVILGLAGCGGDKPADTADTNAEPYVYPADFDLFEGPAVGRVTGIVADVNGNVLEGITVNLSDGTSQVTDPAGAFMFSEVTPGTSLVVSVTNESYANQQRYLTLEGWETRSVLFSLTPVGHVFNFNVEDGGTFSQGPLAVTIPPNAFVDQQGNQVVGEISLAVTAPNLEETGIKGSPGDFQGLDASGSLVNLASFGFFELKATQNGEELQLGNGISVPTEYQMMDNVPVDQQNLIADNMDFWWWNADTGLWEWVKQSTVTTEADGGRVMRVDLPHFSTWNHDMAYNSTCMEVNVVDGIGFPLSGAAVSLSGTSFSGGTSGSTSSDGKVTLWGMANSTAQISATAVILGKSYTETAPDVQLNDVASMGSACPYEMTLVIPVCTVSGDILLALNNFYDRYPSGRVEGWHTPTGTTKFYEPIGEYEICGQSWSDIAENECVVYDGDLVPGLEDRTPLKAGQVTRIFDPNVVAADYVPYTEPGTNDEFYIIQNTDPEQLMAAGTLFASKTYDLKVQGEQNGLPGFETPDAIYMPPEPIRHSPGAQVSFSRNQDLAIDVNTANDPTGLFVALANQNADGSLDNENAVWCRLKDDGTPTVRKEFLSGLKQGPVQMNLFRASIDFTMMPTGYVVRSTTLNMTSVDAEAR